MTSLTIITGIRTSHYLWWKFGNVKVLKVPMRGGRQIEAGEAAAVADDDQGCITVRAFPASTWHDVVSLVLHVMHAARVGLSYEWSVQAGFALVTNLAMDKAPNAFGMKMIALDPIGQRLDAGTALAGNSIVELGLVMGAYDAGELAALSYGEELRPRPHAREWYDTVMPPP